MKTVHIQFQVDLPGCEFTAIGFSDVSPEFKNITLNSLANREFQHDIMVEKRTPDFHPNSLRPLVDEAMEEAQLFIYSFAAAAGLKFKNFQCSGYLADGR